MKTLCVCSCRLLNACCHYTISAVPQSGRAAGVFLFIDEGKYTLNFTAARAACRIMNATIATEAQMERAVQHGLETCKYVEIMWGYWLTVVYVKVVILICVYEWYWRPVVRRYCCEWHVWLRCEQNATWKQILVHKCVSYCHLHAKNINKRC